MIESFNDKDTRKIWDGFYSKKNPKDFQRIGLRKLVMIHRAKDVQDLRIPPGNRLEQLDGDRRGQYSIRMNDQFRICFRWNNGAANDVEIADYH